MRAERIVAGILAHVDAGKTTLSESVLYLSGSIRKWGRVDHGNAFLDTDKLERARGITIFSKQAQFALGSKEITLLDTPGHVDFAAEMERTLQVLDYAILVVNGADGVQSHTMTLWKLLAHYKIPVFIFVNKMDQAGADQKRLMEELQKRLDERCVDFSVPEDESFWDSLAMCEETLMEDFLRDGKTGQQHISAAIAARSAFPCYFGSALKMEGVEEFLRGLEQYVLYPEYPGEFAARVYKITRDGQGNRLTHMKITGGMLRVKDAVAGREAAEAGMGGKPEKADQIRIYSGSQFKTVDAAAAGVVCAVTGLSRTRAGDGLGAERSSFDAPVLQPVLSYRISLPPDCDVHNMLLKLKELEEESPQLHILWDSQVNEIYAQLMGEIEIEVLKSMIRERFSVEVEFGAGSIVYRETIAEPVEGVGHFEPLRHYAEVHLLLEPAESGSGLRFETRCSEDMLDRNWQRLVLSHLAEKEHRGVLIGAEITDMKITLIAGRAHVKHTEGGDFRQATFRAVRQGLKKAKSVLLEPVYEFQLELPAEFVGRAMADVQRMNGSFEPPRIEGEHSIIEGSAPAAAMAGYQSEVTSYTKGRGRLFYAWKGYEPCRSPETIIEERCYDSEKDPENPTGSVFCSHGGGFTVNWDEVERYMHVDSGWRPEAPEGGVNSREDISGLRKTGPPLTYADEKELEQIFLSTYGPIKRDRNRFLRSGKSAADAEAAAMREAFAARYRKAPAKSGEQYLLVDGYNIIFAWDELKELAAVSLDGARDRLIEILSNYQGYKNNTLIVVFDAYKVEGGRGSRMEYDNIHVIYTKEAETADQYIEKAVNKIGKLHDVKVATSDSLVQMIIWGEGATRLSALGLKEEVEAANAEIRAFYASFNKADRHYPFQNLGSDIEEETGKKAAPGKDTEEEP